MQQRKEQNCHRHNKGAKPGRKDFHISIKPKSRGSVAVFFVISMPFLALLRKFTRHQPLAVVGVLLLTLFVASGGLAPWLAPQNPAAIDLLHRLESPSAAHWAGTDELGRDTLSRLLWGARLSLTVSVTVVAVSLALGLAIGGLAGYLGGWIDTALTTFAMNTFLALPGILLAIALAAFLGPGFSNLVLALAIGGWAGYARLVSAQVMSVRDREYVDAARALGAGGLRIFFRHILPNILQPVLVQAAIGMAGVILAEATLSFLGLGIPAPAPSWGAMLNDARSHLFDSPHLVLFPAVAMAGAVLGFNFLGDALARPARPAHPAGDGTLVKLGVVSDTHGLLRPQVMPLLDGVESILHLGDVGDAKILDRLRRNRSRSPRFAATWIATARAPACPKLKSC